MRGTDVVLVVIGTITVIVGSLITFTMFALGDRIDGLTSLGVTIGGVYILYSVYREELERLGYLVAKHGFSTEIYYDDQGLYYDKSGKPYLLKWNEVAGYRILEVWAIPGGSIPWMPLHRLLALRKKFPEYTMTGMVKLGTVQFIKKDGSSVILQNVLFPYNLVPIFNKYIRGNN